MRAGAVSYVTLSAVAEVLSALTVISAVFSNMEASGCIQAAKRYDTETRTAQILPEKHD
jgi:hypothetical protein